MLEAEVARLRGRSEQLSNRMRGRHTTTAKAIKGRVIEPPSLDPFDQIIGREFALDGFEGLGRLGGRPAKVIVLPTTVLVHDRQDELVPRAFELAGNDIEQIESDIDGAEAFRFGSGQKELGRLELLDAEDRQAVVWRSKRGVSTELQYGAPAGLAVVVAPLAVPFPLRGSALALFPLPEASQLQASISTGVGELELAYRWAERIDPTFPLQEPTIAQIPEDLGSTTGLRVGLNRVLLDAPRLAKPDEIVGWNRLNQPLEPLT